MRLTCEGKGARRMSDGGGRMHASMGSDQRVSMRGGDGKGKVGSWADGTEGRLERRQLQGRSMLEGESSDSSAQSHRRGTPGQPGYVAQVTVCLIIKCLTVLTIKVIISN